MKPVIIFFLLTLVTIASGQNSVAFEKYLQSLSRDFDVKQMHADSLDTAAVVILDTREKEEFTVSHIPGARWVGYDDFDFERLGEISRDTTIVVYCSVGYRSSVVADRLLTKGYHRVLNLYGGIFKWANEGRALVNDSTSTQKIHTYNRYWSRFINNPELEQVR